MPQRPQVKDQSNVVVIFKSICQQKQGRVYVYKYGSHDSRDAKTMALRKFRQGKVATLLMYKFGWLDSCSNTLQKYVRLSAALSSVQAVSLLG